VRLRVVEEKSVLRGQTGERFQPPRNVRGRSKGAPLIRLETDVARLPVLSKTGADSLGRFAARKKKPCVRSAKRPLF
jgi:hypothetical protein